MSQMKKIELNLSNIKDNSLIEDCPELNFYPTLDDNISMLSYINSKYYSGDLDSPNIRYYLFWGMTKYPAIKQEDIKHATKLYFEDQSSLEESFKQVS